MVARLGGCKTEQRTKASSSTKAVGTAYALLPESKGATAAIKNGLGTCSVDGTAAYTGSLAVVHSIVLTSPFCSPSSEQYPILHVPAPRGGRASSTWRGAAPGCSGSSGYMVQSLLNRQAQHRYPYNSPESGVNDGIFRPLSLSLQSREETDFVRDPSSLTSHVWRADMPYHQSAWEHEDIFTSRGYFDVSLRHASAWLARGAFVDDPG
jgi:hypothetical protein